MNDFPEHMRKIRSFVVRSSRPTKAQKKALESFHLWEVKYTEALLNFSQIFGNQNDVVIEIGFGMGESFSEQASQMPNTNFLGIEVHRPGIGGCILGIQKYGLQNIRLIEHDAVEVLQNQIPPASIHTLQLFFPDPWHKKRHHKRRIVQPHFVNHVQSVLKPQGVFHVATDWENYADYIQKVMQQFPRFSLLSDSSNERGETKFERRGKKLGHDVWDLQYILKS